MGRIVPLAAVGVAALLLAALALGATRHYSGADRDPACEAGNCTVTFNAKVKKGKVKSVSRFVFDAVPITCDEGDFTVSNPDVPVNGMKVDKQRKFEGVWDGPNNQKISVTGKFSKDWKTAKGTLRDRGDFPPSASGCTTGLDHWKASR